MRSPRLILACFIASMTLGLGLGYWIRCRVVGSFETSDPGTMVRPGTGPDSREDGVVPADAPRATPLEDSALAARLERDLSMSIGVTRWLHWMHALESAKLGDIARLARLARGNSVVTRLVAMRWIELSPQHMFETLAQWTNGPSGFPTSELLGCLFEEWPRLDPEASIAALDSEEGAGFRHWRNRVANSVLASDVEQGLKLVAKWGIESFFPNRTAVAKWASVDPRHAVEFTLAHARGAVADSTIETIGKTWAVQNPVEALNFAASISRSAWGGWHSLFVNSVLRDWTQTDLPGAAAWLASTDIASRNRLSPAFVESWAKSDTAAALAWCESNLTGRSLEQSVAGVLKGVVQRDVEQASELVASMNPSGARAEAAIVVAEKRILRGSSAQPVDPQTLAWLDRLDPASFTRVLEHVGYAWADNDPQSYAAYLQGRNLESLSGPIIHQLARSWTRRQPTDALAWAQQLPAPHRDTAGEVVFHEWRRWQSQAAFGWLSDLPSADPRRRVFFENAIRNMAHESEASQKFAALRPEDRMSARRILDGLGLSEDKRLQLNQAMESP